MLPDQDLIPERDFDEVWGAYIKPSGDLFELRMFGMSHPSMSGPS